MPHITIVDESLTTRSAEESVGQWELGPFWQLTGVGKIALENNLAVSDKRHTSYNPATPILELLA